MTILTNRVVIIGAGIGGLSAAIHLAAAGVSVTVLEQNSTFGGKVSEFARDGFRWDTGASVITMPHVIADVFAAAGRRMEDYLTLLPVDPLTRYFYPDQTVLNVTRDLTSMLAQIEKISDDPRDIEGYLAYLAYAARIHRITGQAFIYTDPPTLGRIARTPLRDMPAVDPLRTMSHAINDFVRSLKLRQMLGRFATYVGASPYLAPATLNVIAHVELNGGVWYPRGGVYAVAEALYRLAVELGVQFRFNAPVKSIELHEKHVQAVHLADGERVQLERLPTRHVIANLDVATVYEKLLENRIQSRRVRRILRADQSCSGFILLLGVEGQHDQLAHHNIFFSSDYPREFDDIFARQMPPTDPTIYLAITAKTDPTHAPQGCENWFVLVNVPAHDGRAKSWDWEAQKLAYRDAILAKLAAHGVDIRAKIRTERIITPVDLEQMNGARHGALYGTSSNDRFNALRRPHNRSADVGGLYFAGGTTHPGGGVPMVMLSGKVAACYVLEDMT